MVCALIYLKNVMAHKKYIEWLSPKAQLLAGVITMNEKTKSEKIQAQILRDAFEGMKGRQPKSDQELKEWLATDEGKMATMFESTGLSAHGDESSGGVPLIQILRDAFEGVKGRQPNSDQELKEWRATGEGKEAESSLMSRFAEIGRS
jgi:mRNA-degrading endonuclease HigB of HigAB toxin-antitoxin module